MSDVFLFESLEVYQKAVDFTHKTYRKDFGRFLDISRSSCFECVPIIDLALKEGLLDDIIRDQLRGELIILSKMLNGLKKSLNTLPITHRT